VPHAVEDKSILKLYYMTTLLDILAETCSASPESTCCVLESFDGKENDAGFLSYSSLWRCLEQHEQWLSRVVNSLIRNQSSDDVVVAYISTNSMDMMLALLACSSLSLRRKIRVPALLNFRWTAFEISTALQSKGKDATTIVIYGPGSESLGNQVASQLGHQSKCFPLPNFVQMYIQKQFVLRKASLQPSRVDASKRIDSIISSGSDEDALIIFTSGTTGGSKGVRLSHRAIATQSLAKLGNPCGYSNETTMLASTVPLFHVGGLSSCLAVLFAGGKLLFPNTKSVGFDVTLVRRSLMNPCTPVNTLVVVPAMLVSILKDKQSLHKYPEVRLILIGGQSAPAPMIAKLAHRFPNARIVQTYACTEGASSLTFLQINPASNVSETKRHEDDNELTGDCVGSPPSHVAIRLYRKSGKTTKIVNLPYQVGIIATRGSHVMNGYWNRGKKEANLNGWFLTNDLGFYDEKGQLYFSGRVKDVIRSGGETVLSNEVERILLKHPKISECAVFPRQDEIFGEAVACAIIVDGQLNLTSIRDWCGEHGLASYKRPRYVFMVDELPRNSSGKLLKHKLVAMYGRIPRSKI
jgi:acyl-CoA synthetase (AMP-forming)/AMP-acid ligase II